MRILVAVLMLITLVAMNGGAKVSDNAYINASYDIGQNFLTIDFTLKDEKGEDIAVGGTYFISVYAYNGSFYRSNAILREEGYIKNTWAVPNLKAGDQYITITTIKSPTFTINTSDFVKLTGTKTGLKPDHIHIEPYGIGTVTVSFHADNSNRDVYTKQTTVDFGRAGFGRAGLNGKDADFMKTKLEHNKGHMNGYKT